MALFGLILRILRNRAKAEEILQQAFVRVWTRAETYDARAGDVLEEGALQAKPIALGARMAENVGWSFRASGPRSQGSALDGRNCRAPLLW